MPYRGKVSQRLIHQPGQFLARKQSVIWLRLTPTVDDAPATLLAALAVTLPVPAVPAGLLAAPTSEAAEAGVPPGPRMTIWLCA